MNHLHHFRALSPELAAIQVQMEIYARQYGLDFFPTVFEVVDADQLNAVAAYGGFPTRYPHWRFGMEYEQLSKGYHYGLQKIYELVINNDPCYAYLLASNGITDHKLVMAHVYGHCDFFKNNAWFSHTNRKMIDGMANHGNRIRRYMDRFGVEEVEAFIDDCLSIEDLIDINSTFFKRGDDQNRFEFQSTTEETEEDRLHATRYQAKPYMDQFINPPQAMADEVAQHRHALAARTEHFPREPVRDVMQFLLEQAPLKPWQMDVLSIIRDEAYYFAPQGQTKIMNEGWATYWHSTIIPGTRSSRRTWSVMPITVPVPWPVRQRDLIRISSASSYFEILKIAGTGEHSARSTITATIASPKRVGTETPDWGDKRSSKCGESITT